MLFLLSSYRFVYNIKNIDFLRKIPEFIEHFIVIVVVVGVDVNVVGMLGVVVVVVVGVMLCLCEHSECNSLSTIQARAAHWPS